MKSFKNIADIENRYPLKQSKAEQKFSHSLRHSNNNKNVSILSMVHIFCNLHKWHGVIQKQDGNGLSRSHI